jgi:ketosteroid isomerase-like protein
MSEVYGINVAKTEIREAYATGDVERLLKVFDPDAFTDMSEGEPSSYGASAIERLRQRVSTLIQEYSVKMSIIIIDIIVTGNTAHDYGWHEFVLVPKAGGETIRKRERYFELWNRKPSGEWKISFFITNGDVKQKFRGTESHWFLSEDRESLTN